MSSGGKTPKNTTSTVTNTTSNIPKFAEPYAMQALGQASALTNVNQNPYQSYSGQRVADFSPLQQQSYQAAGQMQGAPQIGMGTGLAAMGGLGSLNTGRFDQNAADFYMSPYMQNVVKMQQEDAIRQDNIAGTMRGAKAATSGAFGGSRQGIVDSEANSALMSQLGNIQATGLQNSFQQAQSQFNADQARRLQGYGQAIQGAGTLGQLGEAGYNQQMGITNLQNQFGAQQQGQTQQGLQNQYQEFLNRQNFPYQQLGFMSDLLHGLPTDQSSTIYQPNNPAAQAVGLAGGLGSLYAANQASQNIGKG
jgi:uncharacterized protein (DUF3820 family)